MEAGFESTRKAFAAGIGVGTGSDVDLNENVAQEYRMLLEAGLSPMDALRSATAVCRNRA